MYTDTIQHSSLSASVSTSMHGYVHCIPASVKDDQINCSPHNGCPVGIAAATMRHYLSTPVMHSLWQGIMVCVEHDDA